MTSDIASKQAKEALVLDLFDNWPTASPSADNVRAYVDAVEALSVEAVMRSVKQFGSGLVDRNNSFVPPAPEFAANARQWQTALEGRDRPQEPLHNGLLECDWGQGRVDLRGLTAAEQDIVMVGKGVVNGRNLAYMPTTEIKAIITQGDLSAIEGGKTFALPRLGRMS